MIDRILAAAYPEGGAMTVSRLTGWALLGEDGLEPVQREANGALVPRPLYFSDDEGGVSLADLFVSYVTRSRLLYARSKLPLAIIALVAVLAVAVGWLFWSPPDGMEDTNQLLFLDGAIAVAAICFTMRWLKVLVTLSVTTHDADSDPTVPAIDEAKLARMRAASGLPLDYNFDLDFTTTLRGRRRLDVVLAANRKLREGLAAVAGGKLERVGGAHYGTGYNPRDVSVVRLEKSGFWLRVMVVLLWGPACAFPLALLAGLSVLLDLGESPIMALLIFLAGLFFAIWGVLLPLLLVALFVCQWLMGTWLSGIGLFAPLDHRVRIRSRRGRWTTLIDTGQHAAAVEVYNQVARDIRQPLG